MCFLNTSANITSGSLLYIQKLHFILELGLVFFIQNYIQQPVVMLWHLCKIIVDIALLSLIFTQQNVCSLILVSTKESLFHLRAS